MRYAREILSRDEEYLHLLKKARQINWLDRRRAAIFELWIKTGDAQTVADRTGYTRENIRLIVGQIANNLDAMQQMRTKGLRTVRVEHMPDHIVPPILLKAMTRAGIITFEDMKHRRNLKGVKHVGTRTEQLYQNLRRMITHGRSRPGSYKANV